MWKFFIMMFILISSQNDFQSMRKIVFNVDINEHNTNRIIERENTIVNVENVFHFTFILIIYSSTNRSMSMLNSRFCQWKKISQMQIISLKKRFQIFRITKRFSQMQIISLKKQFQILFTTRKQFQISRMTKKLLHDSFRKCFIWNCLFSFFHQIRTKTSYNRKIERLVHELQKRFLSTTTCLMMICSTMRNFRKNRFREILHRHSKNFERLFQTTTKFVLIRIQSTRYCQSISFRFHRNFKCKSLNRNRELIFFNSHLSSKRKLFNYWTSFLVVIISRSWIRKMWTIQFESCFSMFVLITKHTKCCDNDVFNHINNENFEFWKLSTNE